MTIRMRIIALILAVPLVLAADALASPQGRAPGRGGGAAARPSGGAGAGARPSGGAAARPASRPSSPNLGAARPTTRPEVNRPSISQPAVSRPAAGRPSIDRPAGPGANRPSGGLKPSPQLPAPGGATRPATRPNIERPNIERPGAQRPGIERPNIERPGAQRPGIERPNIERPGAQRPGIERPSVDPPVTRPGTRPSTRPETRPSLPNLGGGDVGSRPGLTRPELPGGVSRPGTDRPEITRPAVRPSPGDVGDFLGLERPVTRPGQIGDRPNITRPERPGDGSRPSIERPIVERPGLDRPDIGRPGRPDVRPGRPGIDRPNIGNINIGNTVINQRPGWVNINNNQIININNRWNNQIGGLHSWHVRNPARLARWGVWGNNVRLHWSGRSYAWFGPNWWFTHRHGIAGWHYYFHFHRHPWRFWWTVPTFTSCVNWFTWTAPPTVWTQPIFYDYGEGGNVVYQNNMVYVNGQQVASSDEFAQSAALLATVPPPADEEEAEQAEWLPLGTFTVATDEKDVDPSRVVQLAVSREGIISGTLFNVQTEQAQTIQGQVDKETQRVAFRIGESEDIVVETGLYNLTQDEAPVLVHFGGEKTETYLLVRLEEPDEEAGE